MPAMLDFVQTRRTNPSSLAGSAILHIGFAVLIFNITFAEKTQQQHVRVTPLYVSDAPPPTLIPVQPRPKPTPRLFVPGRIRTLPIPSPSLPLIALRLNPTPTPEPSGHPVIALPPASPPPVRPADTVKPAGFGAVRVVRMPDPSPLEPVTAAAFGVLTAAAPNRPSNTSRIQVGSLEAPETTATELTNRGQVVSGGFGDGSSARLGAEPPTRQSPATTGTFGAVNPSGPKPTTKASVTQSEFGAIVAKTAGPANRPQPSYSRSAALEILQKPRPAYSDEARRLQIEGEVVLEMLFPASGKARVLRVTRGLGHGLDESAVNAAAAIRFRPAMERGLAVDTVATVRIEFQLAF